MRLTKGRHFIIQQCKDLKIERCYIFLMPFLVFLKRMYNLIMYVNIPYFYKQKGAFPVYSRFKERTFYIEQKKEDAKELAEENYADRIFLYKKKLKRYLFISLLIVFSCFLPYVSDFDVFKNHKGFGRFYIFEEGVWYGCISILTLIGWAFAFINGKKKPYRFILLAPVITILFHMVFYSFPFMEHFFLPFTNRLALNALILGLLFTVTFFWLRGKRLKRNYFWHYVIVAASSMLPYVHLFPYLRHLNPVPPFESVKALAYYITLFLNPMIAWIFAIKSSNGKLYRLFMFIPVTMLFFQLTLGFLLKLGSNKRFFIQTIDPGVILSLSLLVLYVLMVFAAARKKIHLSENEEKIT